MKRPAVAFVALVAILAGCGGGGGGGGSGSSALPGPVATLAPLPAPTQTPAPGSSASPSYAGCPTASPAYASVNAAQPVVPGETMFAVVYAAQTQASVAQGEKQLGLRLVRTLPFSRLGESADLLTSSRQRIVAAMALLRHIAGVRAVSTLSHARTASASALPDNDPYYNGFGPGAPYFESQTVPGQWDMHVIDVAQAWGYSQSNSTGLTYNGAVQGAPIAIIDTGVDPSAFDLGGPKIALTKCFVTWSGTQTTGSDATDTDGHGTEVAGVAAADTNNAVGIAGVGHDSELLIYRVYPTDPVGGCRSAAPGNAQCRTTSADVASAVSDAVANGARVINLSMASPPAAGETCAQSDPLESAAIENAIASGVVVVAAAGNEGRQQLDCPAGDAGVIAVSATALNDANPASVVEYVPSYSNYGSGTNWGIAAPGGDPSSATDPDDLHWIVTLNSRKSASLPSTGCPPDYQGNASDCITQDFGTSLAAAHVAGAAALIIGSKPYTPVEVFGMLCYGADNINDPRTGCGRLDVYHAFAAAVHDSSP